MSEQSVSLAMRSPAKSRLTLLALLAVFIGPVLLAYAAYWGHWFTPASTNRGELLAGAPTLAELALTDLDGKPLKAEQFRGKWQLMYLNVQACGEACTHNLYTLHQAWTALGKEQERVMPLFVSGAPDSLSLAEKTVGPAFAKLQWTRITSLSPELAKRLAYDPSSPKGRIYVVDPLGNIPLVYELATDPKASARIGKDILRDLQHLLKLSNIG